MGFLADLTPALGFGSAGGGDGSGRVFVDFGLLLFLFARAVSGDLSGFSFGLTLLDSADFDRKLLFSKPSLSNRDKLDLGTWIVLFSYSSSNLSMCMPFSALNFLAPWIIKQSTDLAF